jgi:hypothetical protein
LPESSDRLTASGAYTRIRDAAVDAAIQFSNAEVRNNAINKEKRDLSRVAFTLRDAITYRFDSLLYHHALILESHESAQETISTSPEQGRDILPQVATSQRFLFDDIIFNSIGLFDYLGRSAGFMLRNARGPKLRWDKLYKWSKHPSAGAASAGNPIYGTRTASLVVEADEAWVRKLTALRSDIIHYESEKVDGRIRMEWRGEDSTLTEHLDAYVPQSFLKTLGISEKEGVTAIPAASELLVGRVFATIESILLALGQDLADRVPDLPAGVIPTAPVLVRRPADVSAPDSGSGSNG